MRVSAPASSANLGPGFDCLALAVDLPFELSDRPVAARGWLDAETTHPAMVAFVEAGGDPSTRLFWRSPIPPGRGLGFSGAARVAGAYLAGRLDGLGGGRATTGAYRIATALEGHPDNAAASSFGGFTVAAGDRAISLPVPGGLSVVVWSPDVATSTDASRRTLSDSVGLEDAAFSIARSSLWVAAIATGDLEALRRASEDRLHQPTRLAARADSAAALQAMLDDDRVLAAWLSGSGPTIASLVRGDTLDGLTDALPAGGRARVLVVADDGVRSLDPVAS